MDLLRAAFADADADGDGSITSEEFKAFLDRHSLEFDRSWLEARAGLCKVALWT